MIHKLICFPIVGPKDMKELDLMESLDFILNFEKDGFEVDVFRESCIPYVVERAHKL
jgi:hypothetical protein